MCWTFRVSEFVIDSCFLIRALSFARSASPAEMGEGAVRLRHLVSVVPFLDRVTLAGSGIPQFVRQRLGHRHAATVVGIGNDPAHRERDLAGGGYRHRDL